LTAPNGPSQQRVIRAALAAAGLAGVDVDVIEAHGTGTTLGDPIEAQALLATYGRDRPAGRPLWLGSIKSNLGHAQAAAGVSGVIKMVMAMRHGALPMTLHVDEPSPQVDWDAGHVRLLTERREWPAGGRRRRAGVSSFGLSGTNVHLVLEEAPPAAVRVPAERPPAPAVPLVVSARTAAALPGQAGRLLDHLGGSGPPDPLDVGFSLATTRAALEHRAVVVAAGGAGKSHTAGPAEMARGLTAIRDGAVDPLVVRGVADPDGLTAFLFSGQGAQRPGMGAELYRAYPAFAAALDDVCAQFEPLPVRELMFAGAGTEPAGLLDRTDVTQCALFAYEVAMFRLLESWGLAPDLLAGHSIGELAAAHACGALSLPDAAALVAARGRLMAELPPGGSMVAVQAPAEEVLPLLTGRTALAAVNGPAAVVLSGDAAEVDAIAGQLAGRGRRTKRLRVSHAFHSPLMEPMLAEFRSVVARRLAGAAVAAPAVPVVSALTGQVLTADRLASADHWVDHVRASVRFADAVAELDRLGATRFVELGPDAVLAPLTADELRGHTVVAVARRERPEATTLLHAVAGAFAAGATVRWRDFFAGTGAVRVELPTYAFDRRTFWLDDGEAPGTDAAASGQRAAGHPLLGAVVATPASGDIVLTGRLSVRAQPWLADHAVLGTVVLPGTSYVELALRAGAEVGCGTIEELTIEQIMPLTAGGATAVQVVAGPADAAGRHRVTVFSRLQDAPHDVPWTRHATGTLAPTAGAAPPVDHAPWPPVGSEEVDISDVYDYLTSQGYHYGPMFRGLRRVWRLGEQVFAEVALPDGAQAEAARYGVHPSLLDAALSACDFLGGYRPQDIGTSHLPFAWSGVTVHNGGAPALRATLAFVGTDTVRIDLADATGLPAATVESLVVRPVSADRISAAALASTGGRLRESLYRIGWDYLPVGVAGAATAGRWASVGADAAGLAGDAIGYRDLAALEAAVAAGAERPELVLYRCPAGNGGDVPARVRAVLGEVLALLRDWLASPALRDARLAIVTEGAVSVAGEPVDLAQAPVWGMVRAAQAEHPGRFLLVDTDGRPVTPALPALGEPELALRGADIRVPRLAGITAADGGGAAAWEPEGTVLVTGGTGGLGARLARHLVTVHGVRHL
ncbi:MAG TPA: type I polyketide synthase, partial [Pseudonocardiaceae bacterium]|nr:type I polyketide synthase [Pseudonocardiaceae bacterium]